MNRKKCNRWRSGGQTGGGTCGQIGRRQPWLCSGTILGPQQRVLLQAPGIASQVVEPALLHEPLSLSNDSLHKSQIRPTSREIVSLRWRVRHDPGHASITLPLFTALRGVSLVQSKSCSPSSYDCDHGINDPTGRVHGISPNPSSRRDSEHVRSIDLTGLV